MYSSRQVFGRVQPRDYPLANALNNLSASDDVLDRALACNMKHDHRVSREREEHFLRLTGSPATADQLLRSFRDYFEERIRTRRAPDYVYRQVNDTNILTRSGKPTRNYVSKDTELARVLDLSGLSAVFLWGRTHGHTEFRNYSGRMPNAERANAFLNWKLLDVPGKRRDAMIRAILEVLNAHQRKYPYQPVWATTWTSMENLQACSPDRWLQVMGIQRGTVRRWIIVLRYTVREVGTLVRPTQLDAGTCGFHFPSPPQAMKWRGGHPMDLQYNPRPSHLRPEFIHRMIAHTPEHWYSTGRMLGRTSTASPFDLGPQRSAHHDLLCRRYGMGVKAWMRRCL